MAGSTRGTFVGAVVRPPETTPLPIDKIQSPTTQHPTRVSCYSIALSERCSYGVPLSAAVQVLLCAVLLCSPIQAKPNVASCDRYTDDATRATCQLLYDSLLHSLAYAYDAGTDDPTTAVLGAAPLEVDAAINTAALSGEQIQVAGSSDAAAMAGSVARAGRHDRYNDGPEQQKPSRYYHSREHEGPSHDNKEDEPYLHKHHTDEDSHDGPNRESHQSGPHGHYAPPSSPLYTDARVSARLGVTPLEGQETVTGDLTPANFSRWGKCRVWTGVWALISGAGACTAGCVNARLFVLVQ
jgi:hypothetical protein